MKRRNVLLIVAHDLGQHISPYGVSTVCTPNLERMAQEGVLFENNFCISPSCSPSRAAIMTGRYSHSNGVMGLTHDDFKWRFNTGERHIAQVLQEQGYDSCLLGNWHENNRIDNVGYQTTVVRDGDKLYISDDVNKNETHPNALDLAERADFYLEHMAERDQPFFLYAGIFEPHRPFDFKGCRPDIEQGCWIPPYIPQETPEQKAAAEEEFGAMQGCIRRMDQAVGKLLNSLRENGLEEDTLVLFTADHGAAMPRAKCTLYDPGIETPLILCGAGLTGNVRLPQLISNVDYFPTLMEYCGLTVPENVQGRSFYNMLDGRKAEPRSEIFAEKTYHKTYDPIRCIRTEKYKYIINFELNTAYDAPSDIQEGSIYRTSIQQYMKCRPQVELYDLETDPWEQDNLAGGHPAEPELHRRLVQWMRETGDPVLDGPVASVYGREMLENL